MEHTIVIDFETYYDSEYSLKEMTTSQYINSPLFEVIGCAYKLDSKPVVWLPHHSLATLHSLPWRTSLCVAHNALFDGSILEWIFDEQPAKYFCTWQAAYPVIGAFVKSVSLASCAQFLGLGEKGTEVYKAEGKHRTDFTPEEYAAYANYCINDVVLTHKLYRVLNRWYRSHGRNVA